MHLPWIIVVLVALGISISCTTASQTANNSNSPSSSFTPPSSPSDLDNRDIRRLWAVALQAINEAELQRRSPPSPSPADTEAAPQRINSKRLKWRPNSKLLNARAMQEVDEELLDPVEAREGTYTWTQAEDINPDYVDVRDHTPKPATWWF
ncbi:hypothetical protein ACLKA6_019245 [Drosophila palustris]